MIPGMALPTSAEAAEDFFYRALRDADLPALENLWANDEQVVCVHPGWPELTGHHRIIRSWEQIFAHQGAVEIDHRLVRVFDHQGVSIRVGREYFVQWEMTNPPPPAMVTNVFRETADGWELILHHASPTAQSTLPESSTRVAAKLH